MGRNRAGAPEALCAAGGGRRESVVFLRAYRTSNQSPASISAAPA